MSKSGFNAGAVLGATAFALGLSLAGPQVGAASAAPADSSQSDSSQSGQSETARSGGTAQPAGRGKATRGSVSKRPAAKNAPANDSPAPASSILNRAATVTPAFTEPVVAQDNSDAKASRAAVAVPSSVVPKAAQQASPVISAPLASATTASPAVQPVSLIQKWAAAAIIPQAYRAAAAAAAPAAATALTVAPAASAVTANAAKGLFGSGDFVSAAMQIFRRNKVPTATAKVAMVQSSGMVWGFVSGTDPEGDPLTYAVKKAPSHGSVTIDDKGVFSYAPGSGFSGTDTFTAVVSDGKSRFNFFKPKNVVKVTVNTTTNPAGTVVDNFDGAAGSRPSSSLWTITTGQWIDSGVQTYTNSPDNVRLDGQGRLILQARTAPDGYTSGEVVTKGKLDTMYGSTSARIQFPAGQGMWPAFWMLGSTYSHDTWNALGPTGWPGCGEIDIMELINTGTTYHVALHGPQISDGKDYYTSAGDGSFVGATGPIYDLTTGFHDYWVMRAPDLIVVGLDDTKLAAFTPASLPADGKWVFNQPMYTTLNLAVGGTWPGMPDDTTPWPSTMLVDSFKYTPLS